MTPQRDTMPAQAVPLPPRVLGVAGLIPFALGALAVSFAPEIKAEAAAALLAYGVVILSFLGGIRWGFAMLGGEERSWAAYGASIVPSLAAWLGAIAGGPEGLLVLTVALGLWFFVERAAPPSLPLPSWYMRLRAGFTAFAVLSLAAASYYW